MGLFDGWQSAHAAAGNDPYPVLFSLGDAEAAAGKGLFGGGYGVLDEQVQVFRLLGLKVFFRFKSPDFRGNLGSICGGVKASDPVDTCAAVDQGIPS